MNRRKLLQIMAGSGMAGGLPMSLTPALAATPKRFFVTVNAGGGWDPTALIDPKGDRPRSDGRGPVNNYAASSIKKVGNISYAGYSESAEVPAADSPGHFDNFFRKHFQYLLVINGIDTETNNHDAGSRFVWSGKLENGYPSFGALAAAATAPQQPLSFISNGGYDFTASLVAPARVSGSATFQELAFPNAGSPNKEPGKRHEYFSDDVYALIESARRNRMQRLISQSSLPLERRQLFQLQSVRNGDNNLNRLVANLPERVERGLKGQADIAVAAFKSGLAVSANLSMGGFDTHGNHDRDQSRRLTELLEGIDYLWDLILDNDMEEQVTVLIGSDFGRTPFYNSNRGKDHWNVTSVMAMGAGVRGNRVIGATDANFNALKINRQSLRPGHNGITLTPRHLHLAMRQLADVPDVLDRQFPIQAESLNLFS